MVAKPRMYRAAFPLVAFGLLLTGCSGDQTPAPAPTVTVTATVTATPEPAPTVTVTEEAAEAESASLAYPSGDTVVEGYPVLVDTEQIDYRVANAIPTEKSVAVAPGVYVGYSDAVPDLEDYLDQPNDGDCAVREKFFPNVGGSCWNGVPPSPQEP
ncbi:hypothetical protein Q6350_02815 [Isoptericola sp. b515]|uniref:hypothetical protein n=1 Tax=Isoptericola sp. b515 TaxID=3064652 RepID=UPI0027124292|nr:hypothetical protein [Isoptericola sp. b515]MDO8147354.1 hypothetical protein [Isoptericola sp. b515]